MRISAGRPSFVASASTSPRRDAAIMARFTATFSGSQSIGAPSAGSKPEQPRSATSTRIGSSPASVAPPANEPSAPRSTPPGTITSTPSAPASASAARRLALTTRSLRPRLASADAAASTVVPTSR
jgi:hypothetical protein